MATGAGLFGKWFFIVSSLISSLFVRGQRRPILLSESVKENKVMMYRRYGQYLRETFGTKVFKVSVDAGFTCPVLDGSKAEGGCAYCNNKSFRPGSVDRRQELRTQIESGIAHQRVKYGANKFIVYFQNFTNSRCRGVKGFRKI